MKTDMKDTSLTAYWETDFGDQAFKILMFIAKHPGMTRKEIGQALGMATKMSSVSGRVNDLMKGGAVYEGEQRPCAITGRSAYPLYIMEKNDE